MGMAAAPGLPLLDEAFFGCVAEQPLARPTQSPVPVAVPRVARNVRRRIGAPVLRWNGNRLLSMVCCALCADNGELFRMGPSTPLLMHWDVTRLKAAMLPAPWGRAALPP